VTTFKISIFLAFCCITEAAVAQVSVSTYANFELTNGEVIWRRVYDRPGFTVDSVARLIETSIKLDGAFERVSQTEDEIVLRMHDKVLEKNGDPFSGLVHFEFKQDKYRVTLTTLSRKMGIKAMNRAQLLGVPSSRMHDFDGVRFEDDYVNKAKTSFKSGGASLKALDFYNNLFGSEFDYQFASVTQKNDL
jgi:hypothetical protein